MLDRMWDRCIGHWEQLSRLITTVTYMAGERGTGRRLPGWFLSLLWRALLLPAFWRDDRPGAEVVETITIGDSDRPTMGSRTEYKALVVNPAWPRDLETLFRPADPRQIPPDAVFSDLGRVGATSNLGTPMLIIGRGTAPDADSAVDGLVKWPRHPVTLRSEWADMDGDYFYLTIGDIYRSKETDFELPEDPAAVAVRSAELARVGAESHGLATARPNGHGPPPDIAHTSRDGGQISAKQKPETEIEFLHHVMELNEVMTPPDLTPTEYGMDLAMAPLERRHRATVYGDLADKITASYKWSLGIMVLAIVAIIFIRAGTGS